MQLHQMAKLHHGVMLVGVSGAGKSTAWRVLFEVALALALLWTLLRCFPERLRQVLAACRPRLVAHRTQPACIHAGETTGS
jgi:putative ribosome biogenesis GTPase RsgA